MVVSSSPLFLFALERYRKTLVKELVWWPSAWPYADVKCPRPSSRKLSRHLVALTAEWIYQCCFHCGLLTHVSMSSAMMVDASHITSCWRDQGMLVVVRTWYD
ncbi:hypothetical protein MRX96_001623 [Rhipicephalus microplus]